MSDKKFGATGQALYNDTRMGEVDIFVAPEGTLPTAPMDTIGGWRYLGVIEPNSYEQKFDKETHKVETGILETIKSIYPTKIMGEIQFEVIEPEPFAYDVANGGSTYLPIFPAAVSTAVAAAPAPTVTTFGVTSASGLSVGDYILVNAVQTRITAIAANVLTVEPLAVAPTAADTVALVIGSTTVSAAPAPTAKSFTVASAVTLTPKTYIQVLVGSQYHIVQVLSVVGNLVTVYPDLPAAPATAATVRRLAGTVMGMGSSVITNYAVMAITNYVGSKKQTVLWTPKALAAGVADKIPHAEHIKLPIKFELYGFEDPLVSDGAIVAQRYDYETRVIKYGSIA
jgi:hypothetical protein